MALLLASNFPRLGHGAIGFVPSASVCRAPAASLRAWTVHGKAVPLEQIAVQRISGPVLTETVVFPLAPERWLSRNAGCRSGDVGERGGDREAEHGDQA